MTDVHEWITLPHNEFDDIVPVRDISPLMPHVIHVQSPLCHLSPRPRSGRYDALDGFHHGCHIAIGKSQHNHSPYSEPMVLIAPYESITTAPHLGSSSAALDRGALFVQYRNTPAWSEKSPLMRTLVRTLA